MEGAGPGWCFAFRGAELLVRVRPDGADALHLAAWEALGMAEVRRVGAALAPGEAHVAVEVPAGTQPPEGMEFRGLRALYGAMDEAAWRAAGRAVQMVEWDRAHRFCGRCGNPTRDHPTERAKHCPSCGTLDFPRLTPAVIVRIDRGDRILLARGPGSRPGAYSVLAGFVEPGESLEEAVAREVREEVGIEVRDVRYFGSQPWPFPGTLMVAFTAAWAGGGIVPQPGEIEEAAWFAVNELPLVSAPLSIARTLIDDWAASRGRDPRSLRTAG